MAESPWRVDLRLTIPASSPWREIAVEVAVKFAEYAGAAAPVDVSGAVMNALGAADGRPAVDLRFSAADGRVTVTVDRPTD